MGTDPNTTGTKSIGAEHSADLRYGARGTEQYTVDQSWKYP